MAVARLVALLKRWFAWVAKVVATDKMVEVMAEWEEVMALRLLRVLA